MLGQDGDELIATKVIISASSPAQQRKGVAAQGKGLADSSLPFIGQIGMVQARASAGATQPTPVSRNELLGQFFLDCRPPQRPKLCDSVQFATCATICHHLSCAVPSTSSTINQQTS